MAGAEQHLSVWTRPELCSQPCLSCFVTRTCLVPWLGPALGNGQVVTSFTVLALRPPIYSFLFPVDPFCWGKQGNVHSSLEKENVIIYKKECKEESAGTSQGIFQTTSDNDCSTQIRVLDCTNIDFVLCHEGSWLYGFGLPNPCGTHTWH
jgi:hypothetical protein